MSPAAATKGRVKRTSVPAPDVTSSASPGLDALTGAGPGWAMLPLELLDPHPANPRRDLGDRSELVESIRAHGVRQNLLVVPHPTEPGRYLIVIGHRRCAGAREAGLTHVPAVVDTTLDEAAQRELMLLENIQRSDLTPVEEADGYQGLLDLGVDVDQIATRTGRSVTTVRSRLRLVSLPEPARAAVHEHRATLEDAAALADLDEETQAALAEHLGTRNFAVELERARRFTARRQKMAPLLDRLAAVGALELAEGDLGGYTTALTHDPDYGGRAEGHSWVGEARALEILEDADGTWLWQLRGYSGDLYVWRPLTAEETAAAEARAAEAAERGEPEWKVAQREADAARERAREQWSEHADVTTATRRDFIHRLLGRKQFTQAETRALLTFIGFELLAPAWGLSSRTAEGFYFGDYAEQVPTWLGLDVDAIGAQAEDDDADPDALVEDAIRTAGTALSPAHQLLTVFAAAHEPIGWARWADPDRDLLAWYALLADLGYTLSDAERDALEPPPGGES